MQPYYGSVTKCDEMPIEFPPQYQPGQPGIESIMVPRPLSENPEWVGTGKLWNKVALITGGDSGIGRAVAYLFAKEGADIAFVYLNEHGDAEETAERIRQLGRRSLAIAGDVGDEAFCRHAVQRVLAELGRIDLLVNNAAEQHVQFDIEQISAAQLERTFRTNLFSYVYFAKAAVPHLKPGSAIINTSSIAAVEGFKGLIDYSASKGAVCAFTRSLAVTLIERGIRVNAVAPGRTWTPFIPATLPPEVYATYGRDVPIGRSAQPMELAPAYLYLASNDSSYMVGQTVHVNGGEFFGL
ncbi:SDR family oxidoreductase [Paenibacillus arenilitoris]|uniref:SDR family oxidoreductase n=1 Tax=Paenibacillus arenilitoris TaxID=2772299 RepID=A0A927CG37_9BACL|nr:SDR family oxidoreductase [Paenibacillus arenilitoris]MBD2867449.1 SDR family oxidoreductase [Paenibacillus arenilitoris]